MYLAHLAHHGKARLLLGSNICNVMLLIAKKPRF